MDSPTTVQYVYRSSKILNSESDRLIQVCDTLLFFFKENHIYSVLRIRIQMFGTGSGSGVQDPDPRLLKLCSTVQMVLSYKIFTLHECVALPNAYVSVRCAHFPSVITTIIDQKVQLLNPLN
jgi:hypothetical protein